MAQLTANTLRNQGHQELVDTLAFKRRKLVVFYEVVASTKEALPPSDRIRSNNWMNCLEESPDILWRPSFIVVQLEAFVFGGLVVTVTRESGCQRFQELPECRSDLLIKLVT